MVSPFFVDTKGKGTYAMLVKHMAANKIKRIWLRR